jgi:hypothetical protein
MPAPVRRGDPWRVTVTLGARSQRPAALPRAARPRVTLSRAALPTAVLLAALWAGAPALGSAATTVSRAGAGSLAAAASPSPARAKRVKLFVVPRRKHGRKPVTLYGIAARTLGDGTRFMEIFRLNKGRLQPTGGRLRNPLVIRPGWILKLPRDARGPGVHLGVIPHVKPRPPAPKPVPSQSAAPPASPAPVQSPAPQPSAASTPSASFSPFQWSGTGSAFVLGGGVAVLALAGLASFAVKRRRAAAATASAGATSDGGTAAGAAAADPDFAAGPFPGTAAAPGRSAPFSSASGASGSGLGRRRPTRPKAAGQSGRPAPPLGGPTWPEPGTSDQTSTGTAGQAGEVAEAGGVAEPGSGQHETAELHAAVLSASAELGRVAAHIAENLSALAEPLTEPEPADEADQPGLSGSGQPQPGKREADSDWSFLSLTKSPADH